MIDISKYRTAGKPPGQAIGEPPAKRTDHSLVRYGSSMSRGGPGSAEVRVPAEVLARSETL